MPTEREVHADRLREGSLECQACGKVVPVAHGFALFLDARGRATEDAWRVETRARRFGERADYADFLHAKRRRPSVDLYAAFRPFNESSRAFAPLIPMLRERLKPGDRILDLWCRTGWTGEWLASEFPEQRVVSIWESGSDVLGTRGFRYWLDEDRRRENLDVVFHDPNTALPFADDSFAVVHGLDSLHRYELEVLAPECLRVCRNDGVVAFPHIHLTNGEPDPFFERGETQRHGTEYERVFGDYLTGSERRAFVMSERRLYDECTGTPLHDEPRTQHYNACLVVAPEAEAQRTLAQESATLATHIEARAVFNPLVQVDETSGRVLLDPAHLHGGVAEMLERHPPHAERLARVIPTRLDRNQRRLYYWAARQQSVSQIARRLGMEPQAAFDGLMELERAELLKLHPISLAMTRLQAYYTTQRVPPTEESATITALWTAAVARTPEAPYLVWAEDGSEFSYADTDAIAAQVAGCLKSRGVGKGDRVLVHAVSHPEFALASLGALRLGAVVVAVDPATGRERIRRVLETAGARLAIARRVEGQDLGCPTLYLSDGAGSPEPSFLAAALGAEPTDADTSITASDPAMVLFTSGSTGDPKGVLLSHGGLYRSSEAVDRAYGWTDQDRFHCPAAPHTMSAFRNAFLTPLHSGARTVLAENSGVAGPMEVLATCAEQGVTILNTTPAFLAYCVQLEGRAELLAGLKMRMLLCTGATLSAGLRRRFEAVMRAPVFDYYGLTETSGACTFVTAAEASLDEPGIGRALDSLTSIVDAEGRELPDGEVGELIVESENLALGYITPDGLRPDGHVHDGARHTGDLARRNADGCIVLVGRSDRMLVDRAGENLYPEEIERALDRLPGVVTSHVTERTRGDVQELVALVVPDRATDAGGERWLAGLREELGAALQSAHVPTVLLEVTDPPIRPSGAWDLEGVRRVLSDATP